MSFHAEAFMIMLVIKNLKRETKGYSSKKANMWDRNTFMIHDGCTASFKSGVNG